MPSSKKNIRVNGKRKNKRKSEEGGEGSSEFVRIVFSPVSQGIRLPTVFMDRHGQSLKHNTEIILKVPTGASWPVKLRETDTGLWLERGWEEFSTYYEIEARHFLLFKYDGRAQFIVNIMDPTGSEIGYPIDVEDDDEVGCKDDVEGCHENDVEENDVEGCHENDVEENDVEGLHEEEGHEEDKEVGRHEEEGHEEDEEVGHHEEEGHEENEEDNEEADECNEDDEENKEVDEDYEENEEVNEGYEEKECHKENEEADEGYEDDEENKEVDEGHEEDCDEGYEENEEVDDEGYEENEEVDEGYEDDEGHEEDGEEGSMSNFDVNPYRLFMGVRGQGEKKRFDSYRQAECFRSANPFFLNFMQPTYVTDRYMVGLNLNCVEQFLPKDGDQNKTCVLKISIPDSDKVWNLSCRVYQGGRQSAIMKGWKEFAVENKIRMADVCVFELVNPQDLHFKITIFRNT